MKVACIQMDVRFCQVEENFCRAETLIREAMKDDPDVIILPEMWNTGFFPEEVNDPWGERVISKIGALAKEYAVNIVAGSVAEKRNGNVYNTAYVFDRSGTPIATYDKTHLFSPMGEDKRFTPGDALCRFTLDGVPCGLIICYDLRFPELSRFLALEGIDALLVVSQWPLERIFHLQTLCRARAIENQVCLACCNGCGNAGNTKFGGGSMILDPLGNTLTEAGENEIIITANWDLSQLRDLRNSFNVFADRRPDLYRQ